MHISYVRPKKIGDFKGIAIFSRKNKPCEANKLLQTLKKQATLHRLLYLVSHVYWCHLPYFEAHASLHQ
jgi:hypothetical protein